MRRLRAPILFASAAPLVAVWIWWVGAGPRSVVLRDAPDAPWIRHGDRSLGPHWQEPRRVRFRRQLALEEVPERAALSLRAFRAVRAELNGRALLDEPAQGTPWRSDLRVPVAGLLRRGANELSVEVENDRGPPALRVRSEGVDLATGSGWEVLSEDGHWVPAVPTSASWVPPVGRAYGTTGSALWNALPLLLLGFLLGAGAAWLAGADAPRARPSWATASALRWALLAAWVVLALNNIGKLHLLLGFDAVHHYEYVQRLAATGRVPLATEGWQAFQSPLFYLFAAPLLALLPAWTSTENTLLALRVIPLVCGVLQVEVAYRSARCVFPEREELQSVATLVGGLLPMSLYLSQVPGNEPLAGLFTSLLVWRCLHLLCDAGARVDVRTAAGLGGLLGLALLSKASALLMTGPAAVAILLAGRRRGLASGAAATRVAAFGGAALLVSGWYYARNWIELGSPFVGGWDPARGFAWWQEPGLRMPGDFTAFGEALVRPIYAATAGFWDGLYSTLWLDGFLSGMTRPEAAPPWNYDLVLATAPLSLPLTLACVSGAVGAWRRGASWRGPRLFAGACIALYLAAMLHLFATLPVYSTVKASYTLGLLPCYAVLAAAGLAPLLRGRASTAIVAGGATAWAVASYGGYFAL